MLGRYRRATRIRPIPLRARHLRWVGRIRGLRGEVGKFGGQFTQARQRVLRLRLHGAESGAHDVSRLLLTEVLVEAEH